MSKSKSYYVATSIIYANDVPHIGHTWEFIIADVLARYYKQQGRDVFFSTGTDEHGGKIAAKAEAEGVTPQEHVERVSTAFEDLMPVISVDYTKFIRTSDEEHKARVSKIWKMLDKYIYKGSYVGMYDLREESYVSIEEAKIMKKDNPDRHKTLQKLEEENYFFKLSEFGDQILNVIKSGKLNIVPHTKRNEIIKLLEDGLEDVSISRPSKKLKWGIPVPGDKDHTIYVWIDALSNYLTTLGYPDDEGYKKYWPCDVHVIGKDISRFHAAIWPGMLLALGEELPKEIYIHGFISSGDEKMSKSLGNVISPLELVTKYGSEATRYYLMRHIPSYNDGDFSWEKMEKVYTSELANDLGNLVQRTQTMIANFADGEIIDSNAGTHDEGSYHDAIKEYHFDRALDFCWELIRGLNQYIDEEKPWVLAKDEKEAEHLKEVMAHLANSLLQLSDLLSPFMPETAKVLKSVFGGKKIKPTENVLFPKIEN